jgi:hypothetical protein
MRSVNPDAGSMKGGYAHRKMTVGLNRLRENASVTPSRLPAAPITDGLCPYWSNTPAARAWR